MMKVLAVASLALAASACGRAAADEPVSFEREVLPALKRHCVMCHLPGAAQGGLSLYPDAWSSLVGVPSTQTALKLVEPGVPDKSYLYLKMTAAHVAAGGSGQQMPLQYLLDAPVLAALRAWIEQGAGRN